MKPHCCDMTYECDHEIPLPPLPKAIANRPSTITGSSMHETTTLTDIDGLSEKYWGEILERSFSSNSLHAPAQYQQHHNRMSAAMMHHNNKSKYHLNDHGTLFSDINLNRSETNLYYSNSEPHLVCEYDLHDINCAKNKAYYGAFEKDDDDI
jgi:hypothetical protein